MLFEKGSWVEILQDQLATWNHKGLRPMAWIHLQQRWSSIESVYQFVAKWLMIYWLWFTLVNNKLVRNSYENGLGEAQSFWAKHQGSPFRTRKCFQMRSHRIASMWFPMRFQRLLVLSQSGPFLRIRTIWIGRIDSGNDPSWYPRSDEYNLEIGRIRWWWWW